MESIPPVSSALAVALSDLSAYIRSGAISQPQLNTVVLDETLPRGVQGVVNLLRVGIAHARASDIEAGPTELFETTLAANTLSGEQLSFAREIFAQQVAVVDRYLANPSSPSVDLVAELGLSLGTLSEMQEYVRSRNDWQLERMNQAVYGPQINFPGLRYVVAPVLKRMAELEGPKLNAIYTDLVMDWCRGKPFASLPLVARLRRREDLISFMYAQVSYLLPWGLWAFDSFVAEEAEARNIEYGHQVRTLAYLVDGGVPDLAALTLLHAGFERSDAARLSAAYFADPVAAEQTQIAPWLRAQPYETLVRIVRGSDHRRVDHDFRRLVRALRPADGPSAI